MARDSSNFDEEVIRFSRILCLAKRRIRELAVKYQVTPILNFEENTLKLDYRGSRYTYESEPIAMHPTLLEELRKGMLRTSSITDVVDRRARAQLEEQKSSLLLPREASKMLGVSYKTLWRWWKEGKIQAVRLPTRRLRYPREEIERILHNKRGLSKQ